WQIVKITRFILPQPQSHLKLTSNQSSSPICPGIFLAFNCPQKGQTNPGNDTILLRCSRELVMKRFSVLIVLVAVAGFASHESAFGNPRTTSASGKGNAGAKSNGGVKVAGGNNHTGAGQVNGGQVNGNAPTNGNSAKAQF